MVRTSPARPVVFKGSAAEVYDGADNVVRGNDTNDLFLESDSEGRYTTFRATVSFIDAVVAQLPSIDGTLTILQDKSKASSNFSLQYTGNGYPAMEAHYYRRYNNVDSIQTVALRDKATPDASVAYLLDGASWADCHQPSPLSTYCEDRLRGTNWTTSWATAFEPDPQERAALAAPDSGLPILVDARPVPVLRHSLNGLAVTVDGSGSHDADDDIASYEIDFGDGTVVKESTASHTYARPGRFEVTLRVTDDQNATASTSVTVEVTAAPNKPPVPVLRHSLNGLAVTVDGSGSHDADDDIASYEIDFGDGTVVKESTASHTYARPGRFEVTLRVTDDQNATASTSVTVALRSPKNPAWNDTSPYLPSTGGSVAAIGLLGIGMVLLGSGLTRTARRYRASRL